MLPQLPLSLPFDLPTLPLAVEGLPGGSPWTWVLAGGTLAVISLWAMRRARRMVVAASMGVVGLLVAWNAGFLPLSA